MKPNRRNSEIFGISFLDVICCGFGAMVLLVLISKTDVVGGVLDIGQIKELLQEITAQQNNKIAAQQQRDQLLDQASALEAQNKEIESPNATLSELQQRLAERQAQAKILKIQTDVVQNDAIKKATTDKVIKVGGIPVDSNYIIFIVDTSGSMQQIWQRVIEELENVLDIHPQVNGFQIMNDNGVYLLQHYARKWIPDTPRRRKAVLALMKNWNSFSNSSPVEGLRLALKTYAKHTDKLAIYIFGDDYSGGSYDPVLNTIENLNLDPKTGQAIARIHGIGFLPISGGVADRFATLMREVTRRNRGAFIGLALKDKTTIVETEYQISN